MEFDRRITLALAFAVLVQLAGGLIWAGAAAERIAKLEQEAEAARPVSERLARVEVELKAVRRQLDRIETKLEDAP